MFWPGEEHATGSAALSRVSQEEADAAIELAIGHGVSQQFQPLKLAQNTFNLLDYKFVTVH